MLTGDIAVSVLTQYYNTLAKVSKAYSTANETIEMLITSYQPEQDIKVLIERYRTGPFRPVAQVYESISHDESDVVFGIDLRRWADNAYWHVAGPGGLWASWGTSLRTRGRAGGREVASMYIYGRHKIYLVCNERSVCVCVRARVAVYGGDARQASRRWVLVLAGVYLDLDWDSGGSGGGTYEREDSRPGQDLRTLRVGWIVVSAWSGYWEVCGVGSESGVGIGRGDLRVSLSHSGSTNRTENSHYGLLVLRTSRQRSSRKGRPHENRPELVAHSVGNGRLIKRGSKRSSLAAVLSSLCHGRRVGSPALVGSLRTIFNSAVCQQENQPRAVEKEGVRTVSARADNAAVAHL